MNRGTWRHATERVQQDIIRLGQAGLEPHALRAEYLKRLRKVIPTDLAFFGMVDPATLLFTAATMDQPLAPIYPLLTEHELLRDDVSKFNWHPRSNPVGHLDAATEGKLERSSRYREIFVPMALGDELRAALRVGDLNWGGLCLHRERSSPRFTAEEAEFLGRIAPHLAIGLRRSLLLGKTLENAQPDGPGMLMVADDLTLMGMTPAAERWLAEITASEWPHTNKLPTPIYAVAASLRQNDCGATAAPKTMPQARVRTQSGRWLLLHASRISGQNGQGPIAILIEPARPVEIAPLIAQAYDLSPRERTVTQLVLRGLSTSEIAAEIHVSAHTVQDHLKAIFDKVGVRSRRELVARIFGEQYELQMEVRVL